LPRHWQTFRNRIVQDLKLNVLTWPGPGVTLVLLPVEYMYPKDTKVGAAPVNNQASDALGGTHFLAYSAIGSLISRM